MMRYFTRVDVSGTPRSLHRFDAEAGISNRFDVQAGEWVDDPLLIAFTGIGGDNNYFEIPPEQVDDMAASIIGEAAAARALHGITVTPGLRRIIIRGGPGSGHFGHEGRPGAVGGSEPSGRETYAEAKRLRAEGKFAEAFPVGGETRLYTDRQAYEQETMRNRSEDENEIGWVIDNRGQKTLLGRDDYEGRYIVGERTSVTLTDENAERIRESRDAGNEPTFFHNHPHIEGTSSSSPPSDKDISAMWWHGLPHFQVTAFDGWYDLQFSHVPDKTEREVWNQHMDIWNEDHPEPGSLTAFRADRGIEPPSPELLDEAYARQDGRLRYTAEQMPDLVTYGFTPWPK